MLTNAMKDELIKGLLNIFADDIKAIILYGSVARNESTSESDIDIAIIMQHDMDDIKRENLSAGRQIWISGMTESFLLLIFRKRTCRNWEEFYHFIRTCKRRELFFGRQPERTCRLSDEKSRRKIRSVRYPFCYKSYYYVYKG